ncbi:MAM and LDL-receptor class A domain-containing protein 1-like isoform X1 [Dreissena polymorpha]|uniref:MAM and LDL-receptor class A domain-containing protein 1-like isoform X1 n=1 Tax=Dreissena polymorpha TaxID=45954 RepID=UPI002264584A|nr:MAM and LDL-receptor class A domain-containing protein 1-like isoform X1 [Dreissena polymorpha]
MEFNSVMLRVVIILGILVNAFVGTHAISCLSCETGYEHLNECNRVVQCSEGQACYIERVMPLDGGRSKYLAGCRDMSLCNIEGCSAKDTKNLTAPSKRSDIVICSECCFRSLCNTQGCGGVFEASSTSIRCFSCPEVYGNMSCNTFTLCDNKTQMCQSEKIGLNRHPHPGAVELGCGNRNKCIFSQQLYINQSVPLEDQAIHCCDSHLCNWKPLDDTGEVESIANKLTCPPDLVAPTTTTTKTTPAPRTTTSTTTPAPTTTITTTTPLPKVISTCNFDDGPCGWNNMAGDNFDWVLYKGPTPTGETDDTGPTADHTFGNASGMYAFIESSSPRAKDDKAWFGSPLLAPSVQSGPQCLHFWYNMNGASIGTLKVFMSQNNAFPGYTIWGLSGNQSRDWKQAHVTLDSHVDFHIIIEGTVGAGFLGDIAIDDIVLSAHPCSEDSTTSDRPPFQLGTESTKCHQCTGPIQICEQIHFSKPCLYPNNYCINHITNHLDGTRTVNRTCGNLDTCYRDWYLNTADADECDVVKNNQHVDFKCTFCCINNDCNVPLRPAENHLYKPIMVGK